MTDITLQTHDYEVLRGEFYHAHDEESCLTCATHPYGVDASWPKLHETEQDGFHPIRHPFAISSPPLELRLLQLGGRKLQTEFASISGLGGLGLTVTGGTWTDITNLYNSVEGFIEDVINHVISVIDNILRVIESTFHLPLITVKDLIKVSVDMLTGVTLLHFLDVFPITHWLYQGVDKYTGGFVKNLAMLESLPGKFLTGQTITRKDVLKSLAALQVVLIVSISFMTGNPVMLVGVTAGLLKKGPLGKTVLGNFLISVAAIGASALIGGTNLISAFMDEGIHKLEEEGVKAALVRAGINVAFTGLIMWGVVGRVTPSQVQADRTAEQLRKLKEAEEAETLIERGEREAETHSSDVMLDEEDEEAITPLTDSELEAADVTRADIEEADMIESDIDESDIEEPTEEEIELEEDASGFTDDDLVILLEAGLTATGIVTTLLNMQEPPVRTHAVVSQIKRIRKTMLPPKPKVIVAKPVLIKKPPSKIKEVAVALKNSVVKNPVIYASSSLIILALMATYTEQKRK